MRHAGFVLVGGRSSRMGRDKALLPVDGVALARHIAIQVRDAAGAVTLVGDPGRYAHLGFPVIADRVQGCGPLGGIVTALESSEAEWNLILACDMPAVDLPLFQSLLAAAEETRRAAVVPVSANGAPQPLCAVYHRRCLPFFLRALDDKRLKVKDLLSDLHPQFVNGIDPARFVNLNSPADWSRYLHAE